MAGESGAPAMSQGGQAGSGGSSADAGETSSSTTGESAMAGAAGASGALDCTALGGHELAGHCYVDATTKSVIFAEAVAACAELANEAGRAGHLLVLDSVEEQAFGEGRCSAFAYNPANTTWGWVDRNCSKATHQLAGYPAHDYRTLCELE